MAAIQARATGVELTPDEAEALERWHRHEAATTGKKTGDRHQVPKQPQTGEDDQGRANYP